ncbi:MAG: hypothetical protein ACO25T_08755 [Arenimonas sp.]|uniref:hypothetical protein n=1 Tax=Arenimonas sp. TaxID=1872635 RepID=UPI003C0F76EE
MKMHIGGTVAVTIGDSPVPALWLAIGRDTFGARTMTVCAWAPYDTVADVNLRMRKSGMRVPEHLSDEIIMSMMQSNPKASQSFRSFANAIRPA